MKLEEKTKTSKIIFQGRLLDIRLDQIILPNGKISTREWVNHPGAVCCVPVLPDGKIGLIKQYRYPIKREIIELPAGKIDKNEKPDFCAKRELEEEIGYRANKMQFLANIHPAIGFTNEMISIYLAEELTKTNTKLDKDEFLILMPTDLNAAIDMIWNGEITDVKTIIGLLWGDKILNKRN